MGSEQIESIKTPIFGNKWILRWESDREMKEKLMREAKLPMPGKVKSPNEIDTLVIVKRQGAAGGKGYFMASSEEEYNKKRNELISQGFLLFLALEVLLLSSVFPSSLCLIPILGSTCFQKWESLLIQFALSSSEQLVSHAE